MDKELVCFVDPFAMDWRVIDTNEEWETYISLDNFYNAVPICEKRGATIFHIVGPEGYAEELAELFNKTQITEYKEYKVKVEVN